MRLCRNEAPMVDSDRKKMMKFRTFLAVPLYNTEIGAGTSL